MDSPKRGTDGRIANEAQVYRLAIPDAQKMRLDAQEMRVSKKTQKTPAGATDGRFANGSCA
jgi:hypothetical protein